MDIKLNTPEPLPLPEPTITLELSLFEANIIRAALGITGGDDCFEAFRQLDDTLKEVGFNRDNVGDLMVPRGPMQPYKFAP